MAATTVLDIFPLYRRCLFYLGLLVFLHPKTFFYYYLAYQIIDFDCTQWMLFQKHVVCSKLDIHGFLIGTLYISPLYSSTKALTLILNLVVQRDVKHIMKRPIKTNNISFEGLDIQCHLYQSVLLCLWCMSYSSFYIIIRKNKMSNGHPLISIHWGHIRWIINLLFY
jgi:hypothetical protein